MDVLYGLNAEKDFAGQLSIARLRAPSGKAYDLDSFIIWTEVRKCF